MHIKAQIITAAWLSSGLVAAASGAACGEAPAGPPPPAEVRLTGVQVYHHTGESLTATAQAPAARLDPESSVARLENARLTLTGPGATLSAPEVVIDLAQRTARGTGGARIEGEAFTVTGAAFHADLDAETLEVSGPVRTLAEVAP